MTLFWLSLIANTVTLVVAIVAAVIRPTPSYRLIAGVAICAFLAALHQVVTDEGNPLALLFGGLLLALVVHRLALNASTVNRNRRH